MTPTPIRFAADTIIRSGHMRMFTPSSAISGGECYQHDVEFFRQHPQRSMFIRESGANEFENGFDAALQLRLMQVYLELPKLWVLGIGDESLYFTIPVYRGAHFFPVRICRGLMIADVFSDRATRILLAEMDSRGGADSEAFDKWRKKFEEAITLQSPKALKSSEAIN
jgi:hypothetical protein